MGDCQARFREKGGVKLPSTYSTAICMSNNRKEYFLYPAITAVGMSSINAFADWKRGTLESIWGYVIAALILYAVIALSRYFIDRKRR